MSTLLQEMKKTDTRKTEDQEKYISAEKKSTRDIPSPKKAYSIFQVPIRKKTKENLVLSFTICIFACTSSAHPKLKLVVYCSPLYYIYLKLFLTID